MEFKFVKGDLKIFNDALEKEPLLDKFVNAHKHGQYKAKGIYPTGYYIIELKEHEAKLLQDKISDLLCLNGIDSNGEINSLGLHIESLIDLLQNIINED